jgi:hypothetical protein
MPSIQAPGRPRTAAPARHCQLLRSRDVRTANHPRPPQPPTITLAAPPPPDGELRQPGPEIMRKLSGAKEKLSLRVHGLVIGSPEKQRADPAVLRALCTNYLPNGKVETLVSEFANWASVQVRGEGRRGCSGWRACATGCLAVVDIVASNASTRHPGSFRDEAACRRGHPLAPPAAHNVTPRIASHPQAGASNFRNRSVAVTKPQPFALNKLKPLPPG